jgi:hypothetical protein
MDQILQRENLNAAYRACGGTLNVALSLKEHVAVGRGSARASARGVIKGHRESRPAARAEPRPTLRLALPLRFALPTVPVPRGHAAYPAHFDMVSQLPFRNSLFQSFTSADWEDIQPADMQQRTQICLRTSLCFSAIPINSSSSWAAIHKAGVGAP